VDGDAVPAKSLGVDGCFDNIGIISTAAIAERGKFVDVYGKPGHAAKVTKRGGTPLAKAAGKGSTLIV
jgi:hypothetical protein